MKCIPGILVRTALCATATAGLPQEAVAQHVTAAMAMTMGGQTATPGCEVRAREAMAILGALNADLERARISNDATRMQTATDAVQKGLADLKVRLEACREGAVSPAAQTAMPGTDHSKMKMSEGTPPTATSQAAVKPAVKETDHAAMGHGAPPAGAPAATTLRQISGPAEAALQSFQDALQVGNRDVALRWLSPDATVTEWGATDASRDAYAAQHMTLDMTFLKTATVVLVDRQVHPGEDSTHIVTTSRVTGRAGESPVNVTVTEGALLKNTTEGWRIVSIEWSAQPIKKEGF